MNQTEIREYGGQEYSIDEGANLIAELNNRTKHDEDGYNSIAELGAKTKTLVNATKVNNTENTGTEIDLGFQAGNFCNMQTPSTEDNYTFVSPKQGAWARVLIDTTGKTEFPTITGAQILEGADFEADALFDMWLENDGVNTNYFFTKR